MKPYATCHKQESRHTKILGNAFQHTVFWCNLKLAQQSGLQILNKQDQTQLFLYDTLPAEFIEKAICMKTRKSFTKEEA